MQLPELRNSAAREQSGEAAEVQQDRPTAERAQPNAGAFARIQLEVRRFLARLEALSSAGAREVGELVLALVVRVVLSAYRIWLFCWWLLFCL